MFSSTDFLVSFCYHSNNVWLLTLEADFWSKPQTLPKFGQNRYRPPRLRPLMVSVAMKTRHHFHPMKELDVFFD